MSDWLSLIYSTDQSVDTLFGVAYAIRTHTSEFLMEGLAILWDTITPRLQKKKGFCPLWNKYLSKKSVKKNHERISIKCATCVLNRTYLLHNLYLTYTILITLFFITIFLFFWCQLKDLNLQPTLYECVALPFELNRQVHSGHWRCE